MAQIKKTEFYLYDSNFEHHGDRESLSCFPGYSFRPNTIEWIRPKPGMKLDPEKVTFYTDNFLDRVTTPKEKSVAWILEPRTLSEGVYKRLIEDKLYEKFSLVLTHDEDLLAANYDSSIRGNFVPYVFGGAWIKPEDVKIYPKSKDFCIISSYKRQTSGHNLRHEIIEKFAQKYGIDVFGNGYKPFPYMPEILKDYRFCIVVENVQNGYWLTEKWTTPVLCGCVPIYYGSRCATPNISVFNFGNLDELEVMLKSLQGKTQFYYNFYMQNIHPENQNIAEKHMISEDALVEILTENGVIP